MPSSSPTTIVSSTTSSDDYIGLTKNVKFSTSSSSLSLSLPPTTPSEETQRRWSRDAQIFEYGSAANPEMKPIPVMVHPAELHQQGKTRVIPFDISDALGVDDADNSSTYSCTSPNLMASFIRINVDEAIGTQVPYATSQAFYVIRGSGQTQIKNHPRDEDRALLPLQDDSISWSTGDLFVVPATRAELIHSCTATESHGGAALYWIHDEPLMNYLGVTPNVKKFAPTLYRKQDMLQKVEEIKHESGDCHKKNRLGVLLGNAKCAQTKTLTHVLWSLLNSIPPHTVQRPHRHNSVALDLCVSAAAATKVRGGGGGGGGVYTLMGKEIDSDGFIVDPIRCEWIPGSAFITPPGWWHSHHNESEEVAWVLPVQDAGLYTHQRTLDIRFVDDELQLHRAGRIRGSSFAITNKAYTQMVSLGARVPSPTPANNKHKKNTGLKRVLSAESLLTSKRLKCTQIGSATAPAITKK